MGEIADMMINGELCCLCGVHLDDDGNGYPVVCRSCWDDLKPKDRKNYQIALTRE